MPVSKLSPRGAARRKLVKKGSRKADDAFSLDREWEKRKWELQKKKQRKLEKRRKREALKKKNADRSKKGVL